MSIKFTKQPDGGFLESGDLPVGTKTVQVYIDGKVPEAGAARPAKEKLRQLREMIAAHDPAMNRQVYELRPVAVTDPALIAKRTAQLVKARAVKKAMRA